MNKKIKGAVVGLGYWGPNLVRNFIKIPSCEIVLACDTSKRARNIFSKEHPNIKTSDNFADILSDRKIQFVAIATPLKTHYSLAKQALLAKKHVLIEKPMTATSRQAKELNILAKKANKIVMVGHTFVHSEAVQEIKKILTKKDFGKFLYFDSTRINLGRFQSDTNVMWDLAPHDFSILNFLLSDQPLTIQATGSANFSKHVEIAHIFITYENNITAHIHVSWLSPVKIRNILISGSKKMITYDDIQPSEKIRIYNKSVTFSETNITPQTPAYRSGNVVIPALQIKESLYTEVSHFVNCIKTNNTPLTDGKDGLRVVQLLEAADKSLRIGKTIKISN